MREFRVVAHYSTDILLTVKLMCKNSSISARASDVLIGQYEDSVSQPEIRPAPPAITVFAPILVALMLVNGCAVRA